MKSKIIETLKNPYWMAAYIPIGLIAVGYFGLHLCSYLDHLSPTNPKSFFGAFDGLAAVCYLIFFLGMLSGLVSIIGLLIALGIFLVHRRHPKES